MEPLDVIVDVAVGAKNESASTGVTVAGKAVRVGTVVAGLAAGVAVGASIAPATSPGVGVCCRAAMTNSISRVIAAGMSADCVAMEYRPWQG